LSGVNPAIQQKIDHQIEKLRAAGINIVEITIPYSEYSFELYMAIMYPEFTTNIARIDGIRFGTSLTNTSIEDHYATYRDLFGIEVKKRLIIGTSMLLGENRNDIFIRAQKIRNRMTVEIKKCFEEVDLIIGPVTPNLNISATTDINKKEAYLSDLFLIPFNMSGMPAMSAPIGKSDDGFPIGLQIIGNYLEEGKMLGFANFLASLNKEVDSE